MDKTIKHLETLADVVRIYWDNVLGGEFFEPGSLAIDLETELVRAEDFLEEAKRNANIRMEM